MIELILSLFLLIGSHEAGHQIEADRLNVDIKWQGVNWVVFDVSEKESALIANAAFVMQDEIGYSLKSKKFNILNGVYKAQYLLRDVLDMNNITDESKALIALSAISDLSSNGVRFIQYNDNTSGLIKTWRF
ncbi:hypothetical protein KAR91_37270 [Candidatus Pacearchaeota archaeon]|nr:hypothetical protein [Candidatus Pacearchaeota archaeon]